MIFKRRMEEAEKCLLLARTGCGLSSLENHDVPCIGRSCPEGQILDLRVMISDYADLITIDRPSN
jgi:hypothetical protein